MPALWPLSLPQCPQRTGYTRRLPNMTIRTDMETGPAKVRYRGGNSPQTVEAAYVLTDAQRDVLETFIMETVLQGAVCFDWPDPEHGGDYVLARVVGGSDAALSFTPVAPGYWSATLKIEFWRNAPTGGA